MTGNYQVEDARDVSREPSDKSRTAALLIGLFTGFVGGHRYFAGRTLSGVLMTCTLGGLGLWWLADMIMIGTGEFRDGEGRRIVRWSTDEDLLAARGGRDPQVLQEVEQLRGDVFELQERVDFLERTLANVRDRGGLPPGRPS
jgi:hypothetical protein